MSGAVISLCNPTSGDWDNFIRENADLAREHANRLKLNPRKVVVKKGGLLKKETLYQPTMVMPKCRVGWDLYLCGAGPSLRDTYKETLELARAKYGASNGRVEVWGCNSAVEWLLGQGAFVTHGFGIDQTEGLTTEWKDTPPVKYYVASTVNPKTIRMLMDAGRSLAWFHNYVGTQTEAELYRTIWPSSVMVGDGLNSVNRALCLAQFMGFRHVYVLGADCALGHGYEMHANGDGPEAHGATSVVMHYDLDGETWHTKPDMLFSAVQLARWTARNGKVELLGRNLPHALVDAAHKSPLGFDRFLDEVAMLKKQPMTASNPNETAVPRGRNMVSKLFSAYDLSKGT